MPMQFDLDFFYHNKQEVEQFKKKTFVEVLV